VAAGPEPEPGPDPSGSGGEADPAAPPPAPDADDAPAGSDGDSAADGPGDSAADDPGDSAAEDSGDSAVDDPGDSAADDPGDSAAEDSGDSAADDPGDSAAEDSGDPSPSTGAPVAATGSSAAPWIPPLTFADHVSILSVRLIRFGLAALGLGSLLAGVLWLVPAVVVARSDAYAVAKEKAERDGTLRMILGREAKAEVVPFRYRLAEDGGRFTFVVRGGLGRAVVESEVRDGRVTRQRTKLVDWSRPLAEQLPAWDPTR
jgi:hypothetical protein